MVFISVMFFADIQTESNFFQSQNERNYKIKALLLLDFFVAQNEIVLLFSAPLLSFIAYDTIYLQSSKFDSRLFIRNFSNFKHSNSEPRQAFKIKKKEETTRTFSPDLQMCIYTSAYIIKIKTYLFRQKIMLYNLSLKLFKQVCKASDAVNNKQNTTFCLSKLSFLLPKIKT